MSILKREKEKKTIRGSILASIIIENIYLLRIYYLKLIKYFFVHTNNWKYASMKREREKENNNNVI